MVNTKDNLTIFSRIEDQAFAFTSDRFLDTTDMIGKQMWIISRDLVLSFFRLIAQRGKFIDVENGDAVTYPKLSESFWDRKAKAGLVDGSYGTQNRFYFFTGWLEKKLLGTGMRDVKAILGEATFKGLRSEKFDNNRTVVRYGRGAMVNGQKVGGQFGRIADLSTTVEIDIFSKVNNAEEAAAAIRDSKREWAKRLGLLDAGHGKLPPRPLLARYYEWFMETEVRRKFLKELSVKKWRNFE